MPMLRGTGVSPVLGQTSGLAPCRLRRHLKFGHLHGQDAHATWHGRLARVGPDLRSGPLPPAAAPPRMKIHIPLLGKGEGVGLVELDRPTPKADAFRPS